MTGLISLVLSFILTTLFSFDYASAAPTSLGPGQVAISTRGRPNGLLDAKLTDGDVVLSFVLEPFPSDGGKAGVKDCELVRGEEGREEGNDGEKKEGI